MISQADTALAVGTPPDGVEPPNGGSVRSAPGLAVSGDAEHQCPTPASIVDRLSTFPSYFLPGTYVMDADSPGGTYLGLIEKGDHIAVDARWHAVEHCMSVNGWVTVLTPPGSPEITAHLSTPVLLARECCRNATTACPRPAPD